MFVECDKSRVAAGVEYLHITIYHFVIVAMELRRLVLLGILLLFVSAVAARTRGRPSE